jgi:hypothetical protein
LLPVPALEKPARRWCSHCDIGNGCKIHATKPEGCTQFYCQYMLDAALPETWRPSDCRMVVQYDVGRKLVTIHVDADRRGAWRKPPFHAQIKHWARATLEADGLLLVADGPTITAVLPDREVDLGPDIPGRAYAATRALTPSGVRYDVETLAPDDPRLA